MGGSPVDLGADFAGFRTPLADWQSLGSNCRPPDPESDALSTRGWPQRERERERERATGPPALTGSHPPRPSAYGASRQPAEWAPRRGGESDGARPRII